MPPKNFPKSPKINQKSSTNRVLGASGSVLGVFWGVFGASWSVLGSSWNVLEASWSVLRASWSVLEPFGPENSVQEAIFTRRGGAYPAQLGRRGGAYAAHPGLPGPPIIKEKKDLVQQDYLQKDLRTLQTPVSEPRHAAGRLRARCGYRIQRAAKLRFRHRAGAEEMETHQRKIQRKID